VHVVEGNPFYIAADGHSVSWHAVNVIKA
jgi:hypothetical protein